MQVYEAIVKGLESAGVNTAFGGNGENVASVMLALKHSRVRPIMTRHEQAASFMACGYAMYTNKLGVCFATVGPGAFNLFSGLARFELMTALQNDVPVIWVIFNDGEYKLVKLYQIATYGESGLVEFANPDFAAYAKACGADGHRVETLAEFESAFAAALTSGRPTVIDAKITRWALPHYSTSPEGVIPGIWESLEERFRRG